MSPGQYGRVMQINTSNPDHPCALELSALAIIGVASAARAEPAALGG